uniref:Transposase n=1 Tax=Ditylenchus dipsaci TaxID=166011 RepID=A0A915DJK2_9BILA
MQGIVGPTFIDGNVTVYWMANPQLVHSQRIGAKTSPITYTEDRRGCYIWTKTGRTTIKEGIEQAYFRYSGRRQPGLCTQTVRRDTINVHKRIHGIRFKLRAQRAIEEVRKFADFCGLKSEKFAMCVFVCLGAVTMMMTLRTSSTLWLLIARHLLSAPDQYQRRK